jgi:hypothetical protein
MPNANNGCIDAGEYASDAGEAANLELLGAPLRYIARQSIDARNFPIRAKHRRAVIVDPAHLSIGAQDSILCVEQRPF